MLFDLACSAQLVVESTTQCTSISPPTEKYHARYIRKFIAVVLVVIAAIAAEFPVLKFASERGVEERGVLRIRSQRKFERFERKGAVAARNEHNRDIVPNVGAQRIVIALRAQSERAAAALQHNMQCRTASRS